MVFDMKSTDNRQNADDEALEAYNLSAPEGSTRNVAIVFWLIEASLKLLQVLPGDLGAREGRQHPSTGHPLGTLVQITCVWIASGTPLITFFF